MTLESDKNLGGVGAILIAIGSLPFLGVFSGVIALIGLILVLIAMKGLADYYKDSSIFNNVLYGIITVIVGVVAFVGIVVTVAIDFLREMGISRGALSDWAMWQRIDWQRLVSSDIVWRYVGIIFLSLIILFVFFIITAVFLRRSLSTLADKSRVGMFGTTGWMVLIGAILTIIVIGFLLLWVAMILLAVAFFSIPLQPPQPTIPPPGQAQQ